MITSEKKKREQIQMFCIDDLVPEEHLLRKIDKAIDWSFIYELVKDKYSEDKGRPSIDPVTLIKIPMIQYLYGIRSMRQTIKEIEVNLAYRWFLGLDITDKVPHFTTFGKNYTRRFKDTDLFEQIFAKILEECFKYKFVNPKEVFVDATHVKACANGKKYTTAVVREEALFYEKRKETIERLFGTAKEHHGFRYTQLIGKARMNMKVGLTFACLNLKKLAKMLSLRGDNAGFSALFSLLFRFFFKNKLSFA